MSGLVEHNDWFAHETAVIDEGCSIGAGSRIWHFSHIMPGAVLGEACNIGQNVVISPDVVLGRNCKVQNNVSLYTGVTCEDDVFLGPSCVFTNVTNPRSAVVRRDQYARTRVGRGASIGANATIVCGHDIGPYAFVGAGASQPHTRTAGQHGAVGFHEEPKAWKMKFQEKCGHGRHAWKSIWDQLIQLANRKLLDLLDLSLILLH